MTSFRAHIRAWSLALIAALLLVFDAVVWVGFDRIVREYVDSRLKGTAIAWAHIVESNATVLLDRAQTPAVEVATPPAADPQEQRELREAALSIMVLDVTGRIVWKGASVTNRPTLDPGVVEKVREGVAAFQTLSVPDASPIRRVSVPINAAGELRYILQAESSLSWKEKAMTALLALLGAATALMLWLGWLGSGWLARQVLAPLEALTGTAQRISESSLDTRLTLSPPYEEFHRLGAVFNTMMDRLQRVFESQRRFLADAAHELQTPLTVLKGNLEVVFRKKRGATEYRQVLISNLDQVERLILLCRSLITLAKCADDGSLAVRQPIALDTLVEVLVDEMQILAADRDIKVTLSQTAVPPILGDEAQLKRVVVNLLDNAIRYSGPGGTVAVDISRDSMGVCLSVRDTGPGISGDHLPHIFERFYRADSARARDSGGSGLGLAIAKEIIESHGGHINVASTVGAGTCFTVRLPAAAPTAIPAKTA